MARQYNSGVGFIIFLVCFLASMTHTGADDKMVPAIFVFGDSQVDVGNNNYIKDTILKANYPPNGIDFPGRKSTGRYTNGKNLADLLAEKLGLPTSLPYLSLRSASNKSDAFLRGVSFASGGAHIMNRNIKFMDSLSMDKQIEYFSTVYGTLVNLLGPNSSTQLLSKSLFLVVIGSNDLRGYFVSKTLRKKMTLQQLVDLMSSTLQGQLRGLYNLGARKFVILGVGGLGCTPEMRYKMKRSTKCNEKINQWAQVHNEGVKAFLQKMKSDYNDTNYSFADSYSMFFDLIQNPVTYGFTNVKAACCGLGWKLNAALYCTPISIHCSNRRKYVFWDRVHPTEAAYSIFVDNFYNGSEPYVYPMNVRQLAAL